MATIKYIIFDESGIETPGCRPNGEELYNPHGFINGDGFPFDWDPNDVVFFQADIGFKSVKVEFEQKI